MSLISVDHISKYFDTTSGRAVALDDMAFTVNTSEFVGIIGKSGSGKTTLINMISGIDRPSSGSIQIDGMQLEKLNENELSIWRGKSIGIVFQFFQLLPVMTILENILLPMDFLNAIPMSERTDRAYQVLDLVNLRDEADKFPHELSGGQQQTAAIARALANDPPIIIADEPTGNLDSVMAEQVIELFEHLVAQQKTILMVTHDTDMVKRTHRIIHIADGKIVNPTQKADEITGEAD